EAIHTILAMSREAVADLASQMTAVQPLGAGKAVEAAPKAAEASGTGKAVEAAPKAAEASGTGKAVEAAPKAAEASGTGKAVEAAPKAAEATGTGAVAGEAAAGSGEAAAVGGGEAAAAGGLGAIAAAAGPAAIAVAAIGLACVATTKVANAATKGIEGLGNVAAKTASGDGMGAFNSAVDGATGALEQIPIVGQAVAAELKLAVAPLRAFNQVADAFVRRGREIAAFSGPLSSATANADIRRLTADQREARALGESLARITDAESRREVATREMMLPIRQALAKITSAIDERVTGIAERLAAVVNKIAEFVEKIWENGPKQAFELYEMIEKQFTEVVDGLMAQVGIQKNNKAKEAANDAVSQIEKMLNNLKNNPNRPRLRPRTVMAP